MSGSEATPKTLPNGLPDVHRYITTHNQSGKAIFTPEIPPSAKWQDIGGAFKFFLGYTTHKFPASLKPSDGKDEGSTPEDIVSYKRDLENPGGLAISGGTVCRFVDFSPGSEPVMHRTTSLDYGVVLEGSMECILDSGEVQRMNRGDVCVQRATNHAWRNVTENNGWARMMFVLTGSEAPVVAGKTLGEDLGQQMPEAVKKSD
ncbi:hypothetical protein G7Y89_g9912 [Cudoniella acicularis]|uniref:Uncharacterized protein n=1 Tax=Cudoniella acicularis TaxID=354080 RepID=A0A8H4VZP2_9HELO|nr:hypothetical protein G7Y89_g9912 [Cudoniella acicularis]